MEESLKRLKKGRGTDKSSGSQGFTDDDKIRQQVMIDIENYGQQVCKQFDHGLSKTKKDVI